MDWSQYISRQDRIDLEPKRAKTSHVIIRPLPSDLCGFYDDRENCNPILCGRVGKRESYELPYHIVNHVK